MTVFHKITHNFSHNFAKTKVICKCKYDKPSRFHLKEKKQTGQSPTEREIKLGCSQQPMIPLFDLTMVLNLTIDLTFQESLNFAKYLLLYLGRHSRIEGCPEYFNISNIRC